MNICALLESSPPRWLEESHHLGFITVSMPGVQVEMLAPAPLRCPISLDCPPICPQITPCGHVFSFHAILQHLVSASGAEGTTPKAAVKCPLCYTLFGCKELRLVRVLPVQPLQVTIHQLLPLCQCIRMVLQTRQHIQSICADGHNNHSKGPRRPPKDG